MNSVSAVKTFDGVRGFPNTLIKQIRRRAKQGNDEARTIFSAGTGRAIAQHVNSFRRHPAFS